MIIDYLQKNPAVDVTINKLKYNNVNYADFIVLWHISG